MIPKPPELDPATSPDMLNVPFTLGLWGWLGLALTIVLLAVIVVVAMRLARKPVAPPTTEQIARGKIMELQAKNPDLRESATELSFILRSYLAGRSEDPALYETQQEFNRRANALSSLPDMLQTTTRDLLQRMSTLKYSSQSPQDDELKRSLFSESLDLINNIEQELAAREAERKSRDDAPARPEKISF